MKNILNIKFLKNKILCSTRKKKAIFLISFLFLFITSLFLYNFLLANPAQIDCNSCIEFTASPTIIDAGESSVLTLKIQNDCSNNGIPFFTSDFDICSITPGVITNETLVDGNYSYTVSPMVNTTYTVVCTGPGANSEPRSGGTVEATQLTDSVTITVILNQLPIVTNLIVTSLDYCTYSLPTSFSWNFSDADAGDVQEYYQVQIDNNSNFSSIEIDSGKVYSPSGAYMASGFSYNTTYYWRLKVWDNRGASSAWTSGSSFTTPLHKYPDTNFTWAPSSPSIDEIVQLCSVQTGVCATNQSTCYNASNNPISCSGKTFLWTLPSEAEFATTSVASTENPQIKFIDSGNYMITLKITDNVGSCSITKPIQATLPLPEWEETTP